jgi:Kef-type K+ transport system membrane component KefB
MRKLKENNNGSIVPIIAFFLTIIVCGALYTVLFLEFGLPTLKSWIPASDAKELIITGIYAIPLIVALVGVLALLLSGLKHHWIPGENIR